MVDEINLLAEAVIVYIPGKTVSEYMPLASVTAPNCRVGVTYCAITCAPEMGNPLNKDDTTPVMTALPFGVAFTAARTFSLPAPYTLFGTPLLLQAVTETGVAVLRNKSSVKSI